MADTFQEVPFVAMAGTGNTFAVVEWRAAGDEDTRAQLARELCAPVPGTETRFDGVLVVATHGVARADVAMEVWNADGSRAAACGNGLRVVGKYVGERAGAGCDALRVLTDSGVRDVDLERAAGRVVRATATLGRATPFAGGVVRHAARELAPDWIEVGNRHAVLFAPDATLDELRELGPVVERSFAGGVNVELVAPPAKRGLPFTVRVWERGVGETAACGSGACAVATAARARDLVGDVVDLDFPGGRLRVTWTDDEECRLTGDCEELGPGVIAFATRAAALRTKGAS